ncbi:MAG: hypothetical protein HY695_26970 [Deltaproteobacteria bacterium]|nr:hypothetical protein [Deltaproteobacteria bacterium]
MSGEFHPNPYLVWQREQGIPIYSGYFVEDLRRLEVGFWRDRNANGAFVNLSNSQVNGAYVLEIPRGEKTHPSRQLFDELAMVIEGQGATSLWYDQTHKRSFEWQEGSVFAIPPNVRHEHYAMGTAAKLVCVTSAPVYMQLFNNSDFIFNNDFRFTDRYAEEENFFAEMIRVLPALGGIETNLIADVRQFFRRENIEAIRSKGNLPKRQRAHDAYSLRIRFAKAMMILHLSGWSVGTYKKAHRHGPGYYIVILDGEGYSLMWEESKKRERIDWHRYSMLVPPMMWFHQHFNVSPNLTRFIAFHPPGLLGSPGWSGEGSDPYLEKGLNQIEYTEEDPDIRALYELELAKRGVTSQMPDEIYKKGIAG